MHLVVRQAGYLWRPLSSSEEDTEFVLRLRNEPTAQAAFFSGQITRADHLRFLKLAEERGEVNWIIEKGDERIGASGIYRIDRKNRRAEGGRIVVTVPDVHFLNYVVSCHVTFEVLGLNKLTGEAMATNLVSNRCLERLGFVREGVLREHVVKDGIVCDVNVYGVLASDWRTNKRGLFERYGTPEVIRQSADETW